MILWGSESLAVGISLNVSGNMEFSGDFDKVIIEQSFFCSQR